MAPNPLSAKHDSLLNIIRRQKIKVSNNLNDIGQALYFAINYRQWRDVRRLLLAYQKLPGYDPFLIDFAQGRLAYREGNLALATSYYQKILRQKPNFTRIKLELARVYFEDQKNRESKQLFEGISQQQQLPEMVLNNIGSYLAEIALRNGWQSSLSFGYTYDDNINMSPNQKPICLVSEKGKCIIKRQVPKPVTAWGGTYNATLNRRYQLVGHHGIFGRGLIYGENYSHYHNENENRFLLVSGYNYKNRFHDFSFGPLFEYQQSAGKTEYHAIGAKMEWQWAITKQTSLNVELEHKKLSYPPIYRGKDNVLSSSYFSLSHAISEKLILFGGGNWRYGNYQDPADCYQQWGVSAGIAGQLYPRINGSLSFTLRKQRFSAYSALLGARRQDNEQIYTAAIKFPAAKVLGMTPSLTFRHHYNHSNVNWLYSYDKNEIQIQLEKYF
ncbi:porin family protein [Xenorhabdus doucetiae]|nr:porin family protein [Xenorhabdus doucetiae]